MFLFKKLKKRKYKSISYCFQVCFRIFPSSKTLICPLEEQTGTFFHDGFSSEECVFSVAFYNFLFFVKNKKPKCFKAILLWQKYFIFVKFNSFRIFFVCFVPYPSQSDGQSLSVFHEIQLFWDLLSRTLSSNDMICLFPPNSAQTRWNCLYPSQTGA